MAVIQPEYFGCQSRSEHRKPVRCSRGVACTSAMNKQQRRPLKLHFIRIFKSRTTDIRSTTVQAHL